MDPLAKPLVLILARATVYICIIDVVHFYHFGINLS